MQMLSSFKADSHRGCRQLHACHKLSRVLHAGSRVLEWTAYAKICGDEKSPFKDIEKKQTSVKDYVVVELDV